MAEINSESNKLNIQAFIGKKVLVDISCSAFGFCYPEENILIDITESEYVFMSDEIESEDHLWRFPLAHENCSCIVSLVTD